MKKLPIKDGFRYERGSGIGSHPCGGAAIIYPDGRKVYKCLTKQVDGIPVHAGVNPDYWQAMDDAELGVVRQ